MKEKLLVAAIAALALATSPVSAGGSGHRHAETDDGHAAALGEPGDPAKISRTVAVEMNDAMRFKPARIQVKRGETIRFVLTNTGKLEHEMVLGSLKELKEHAAQMRRFPEMEHADPNMASVKPGTTGELVWYFTQGGDFDFACLEPGHFEAGMIGKISVRQ